MPDTAEQETEMSLDDRGCYRALMQIKIEERRRLKARLPDLDREINEYGYALFGSDYDPEKCG